MKRPRIAVVGYGSIAADHIQVFRHLGADIVASCNRSRIQQQRAIDEAGIQVVYSDAVEMVDRERPDGVVACASVMSQFEVASRLIPTGVPILLEKPPGTSLGEVSRLASLARRHSTPVMVGLNRRFYSVYHEGLRILGGRQALTAVSVEWSEDPEKMLAIGHPEVMIPRLNYVNSLHGIDLLSFFGGRAERRYTFARNLDPTPETLRWQMAWHGIGEWGASMHFSSSWDVPGRWRLIADAPGVRLVSAPLETCHLFERNKPPREVAAAPEDAQYRPGFFGQDAYFLRVAREQVPVEWPACSLEEAIQSMTVAEEITDAILKTPDRAAQ